MVPFMKFWGSRYEIVYFGAIRDHTFRSLDLFLALAVNSKYFIILAIPLIFNFSLGKLDLLIIQCASLIVVIILHL